MLKKMPQYQKELSMVSGIKKSQLFTFLVQSSNDNVSIVKCLNCSRLELHK